MTKKRSKIMTRVGVLIALAALLMIVPQPASAQLGVICNDPAEANLSLEVASQPGTITPITGVESVTINYRYQAPVHARSINPIQLEFDFSGEPGWANVVPSTTNAFIPISDDNNPTDVEGSFVLDIDVGATAPAFGRESFTVTATSSEGTCVGPTNPPPVRVTIQPGFHEQWQVRFEQSIHSHGQNSNFQIPLRIDNLGNGMIEVRMTEVQQEGQNGPRLDVVLPGGFHQVGAEVQGRGDPTVTLPIDVQTPFRNGYMNERIPLAIEVSGRSADEQTIELTPAQLNAQVQTQGVFVPGFGAVTAVLAFLGVAMLMVHRRQD